MANSDKPLTAVVDVDGTLVDTNYQHALAWHRALCAHGYRVQMWEIHRHIGMGGDQIVTALAGEEAEEREGDEIRASESEVYGEMIDEVEPMDGARELLVELGEEGATVILASSAKGDEIDHYLDLLEARDLVAGWTSSADVARTKPDPQLVDVALGRFGAGGDAVMIGDSTWDIHAAEAAGLPTLAVLTGGFSEAELREAGAAVVVHSIGKLREDRGLVGRVARGEF